MANVSKKLAVTTAGVVLSFTAMEANPVQAAVITFDFTITETPAYGGAPILNEPLSGFYSYDDSTTPAILQPGFPPKFPLIDFDFNFLGDEFSVSDLVQGAGYGGSTTGLLTVGFKVEDDTVRSQFVFVDNNFFGNPRQGSSITGSVTYSQRTSPTPVPEPATLGGLCALGLSSIFLKKKGASKCNNN